MIAVVIQNWGNMAVAIALFIFGAGLLAFSLFNLVRLEWQEWRERRARHAPRFPLPVSHTRAARVVPLSTTVLLCLVTLEIGFFAGSIGFGFYLTAP